MNADPNPDRAFQVNLDPNPDPGFIKPKTVKEIQEKNFYIFFFIKNWN
jgi:hypothetical protein